MNVHSVCCQFTEDAESGKMINSGPDSWMLQCIDDTPYKTSHMQIVLYRKIPKYSDGRKIYVIILKFEQCGPIIE